MLCVYGARKDLLLSAGGIKRFTGGTHEGCPGHLSPNQIKLTIKTGRRGVQWIMCQDLECTTSSLHTRCTQANVGSTHGQTNALSQHLAPLLILDATPLYSCLTHHLFLPFILPNACRERAPDLWDRLAGFFGWYE